MASAIMKPHPWFLDASANTMWYLWSGLWLKFEPLKGCHIYRIDTFVYIYHLPETNSLPLKINGWFRCISYWNGPFLVDMLAYSGAGKRSHSDCSNIPIFTRNYIFIQGPFFIAMLVYGSVGHRYIYIYIQSSHGSVMTSKKYLLISSRNISG